MAETPKSKNWRDVVATPKEPRYFDHIVDAFTSTLTVEFGLELNADRVIDDIEFESAIEPATDAVKEYAQQWLMSLMHQGAPQLGLVADHELMEDCIQDLASTLMGLRGKNVSIPEIAANDEKRKTNICIGADEKKDAVILRIRRCFEGAQRDLLTPVPAMSVR